MAQGLALIEPVAVAPALLADGNKTGILQVLHDFLDCALSDAHLECHVSQSGFVIAGQTNQYMTVVAEKSPIAHHLLTSVDRIQYIP